MPPTIDDDLSRARTGVIGILASRAADLEDIRAERELDAYYEAHKHEWEFGIGDLVVIVSQGTGKCIYLGQDETCHHLFWHLQRQVVIGKAWKQGEIVSRVDWAPRPGKAVAGE